jgi:hypothetical protein
LLTAIFYCSLALTGEQFAYMMIASAVTPRDGTLFPGETRMVTTLLLLFSQVPHPYRVSFPRLPSPPSQERSAVGDQVEVREYLRLNLKITVSVAVARRPEDSIPPRRSETFTMEVIANTTYRDVVERVGPHGERLAIRRIVLKRTLNPAGLPTSVGTPAEVIQRANQLQNPISGVEAVIERNQGKIELHYDRRRWTEGDVSDLYHALDGGLTRFIPGDMNRHGESRTSYWTLPDPTVGLSGPVSVKVTLTGTDPSTGRQFASLEILQSTSPIWQPLVDRWSSGRRLLVWSVGLAQPLNYDPGPTDVMIYVSGDMKGSAERSTRLNRPLSLRLEGPIRLRGGSNYRGLDIALTGEGTMEFTREFKWLKIGAERKTVAAPKRRKH